MDKMRPKPQLNAMPNLHKILKRLESPEYVDEIGAVLAEGNVITVIRHIADNDEHNFCLALYISEDEATKEVSPEIQFQRWTDADESEIHSTTLYGLGNTAQDAFTTLATLCAKFESDFPKLLADTSEQLTLLIEIADKLVPAGTVKKQNSVNEIDA